MSMYDKQMKKALIEKGWISVKDRLPEKQQKVLLFLYNTYGERIVMGYRAAWTPNRYYLDNSIGVDAEYVLYWMQLPEPPKEE